MTQLKIIMVHVTHEGCFPSGFSVSLLTLGLTGTWSLLINEVTALVQSGLFYRC